MKLNDANYAIMKWVTQLLLPATATLYFAVAKIWGFPNGVEVVGTITAIDAFLGVILSISTSNYKNSAEAMDGTIIIDKTNESKDLYSLNVNSLEGMDTKDTITLKVMNGKIPETDSRE